MEMEEIKKAVEDGISEGIKSALAALPAVETKSTIVITKDEGDRPFKSLAAQAIAVKNDVLSIGRVQHPRLQALKFLEMEALKAASGASEIVPADGGYL